MSLSAELLEGLGFVNARAVSVSTVGRREGLGENLSPLPCIVLEEELESPSVYPAEWHDRKAESCLGFLIWLVVTGRQGSRPRCVLPHRSSGPISRDSHPAKHPTASERAIYLFLNGT